MNFLELIQQRESVRNYDPDKLISQDILLQIAEAGRLAPSAANRQPWRIIFVSSPEALSALKQTYNRDWFADAPHVLVVVGDRRNAWTRSDGYNSLETDLTITMDYMILMAEYLGVSSCWVGNFDYELLRDVLNLAPTEEVFAFTPLGYPQAGFQRRLSKARRSVSESCEFL